MKGVEQLSKNQSLVSDFVHLFQQANPHSLFLSFYQIYYRLNFFKLFKREIIQIVFFVLLFCLVKSCGSNTMEGWVPEDKGITNGNHI